MHDETRDWILAKQGAITLEDIKQDDVMMLDVGSEIFVCVGDDAPVGEKKHSMIKAQNFLMATEGKPNYTPLHRVKSGQNPRPSRRKRVCRRDVSHRWTQVANRIQVTK